jgi:hypothetical protein
MGDPARKRIAFTTSSGKLSIVGRSGRPGFSVSGSPDRSPPSTGQHTSIQLLSVAEHREPIYTHSYFRPSPGSIRRPPGSEFPRGSESAGMTAIHTILHLNNLKRRHDTRSTKSSLCVRPLQGSGLRRSPLGKPR